MDLTKVGDYDLDAESGLRISEIAACHGPLGLSCKGAYRTVVDTYGS